MMNPRPSLRRISYTNYRAYRAFSLDLEDHNVLTGPNNAGKSSIVKSLQLLRHIVRLGGRRLPDQISVEGGRSLLGYRLPRTIIPDPVVLKNVDYLDEDTVLEYFFSNECSLSLHISEQREAYCIPNTPRGISSVGDFRRYFAFELTYVPVLGPLEDTEAVKDSEYVDEWMETHRASRLFRNYWLKYPEKFEEFAELIAETWPGASVEPPIRTGPFQSDLSMICKEGRDVREVAWAGYGFQIWLQLLTHIVKNRDADMIVVDEPEIYLHPDLQQRILEVVRKNSKAYILATHSVEIINCSVPSDLVLIDKKAGGSKRILEASDIQKAARLLGLAQNIHLTRLFRSKRVLFVEGADGSLLRQIGEAIRETVPANWDGMSILPLEALAEDKKATGTDWAFSVVRRQGIKIGLLIARKQRPDIVVEELRQHYGKHCDFVHVTPGAGIQNELILEDVIVRAIVHKARRRGETVYPESMAAFVHRSLDEICAGLEADVRAGLPGRMDSHAERHGLDANHEQRRFLDDFETRWQVRRNRPRLAPGRQVLAELNARLQERLSTSASEAAIIQHLSTADLDPAFLELMQNISAFSAGRTTEDSLAGVV